MWIPALPKNTPTNNNTNAIINNCVVWQKTVNVTKIDLLRTYHSCDKNLL